MMAGFELNATVNADKIFLVNHVDLINRIDPYYYKGTFHTLRKKLISKGFVRLGTFVESWNRGDGPRDGYYTDDVENGVYFIRVNNLRDHTIDLLDIKYINRAIHETKLKRAQVAGGDVIFAISGTKDNLGTVSIVPDHIKEANLNSALVRFDLKESINKKFFCILFSLNFIRTQIEFTGKGAAQNNLNNDEINSFLIPSIDLQQQKRLVNKYELAIKAKEQKEQQAQTLLDSIDEYLLGELGIELPEQDNGLKKRIFTVRLSEVDGGRFDPDYFKTSYQDYISNIKKSKYKLASLGKVTSVLASGKTPASFDYSETPTDYPIIKVGSYTQNYINLEKTDFTYKPQKLTARKGDIFVLSAAHQPEYVGRHVKYLNDIPKVDTSYVGELICIRTNQTCNPIYLFALLMLNMYKTLINREKTGQTSHVYGRDIKVIKIPLPPIEKQNEIADHISKIRAQARQLQGDANKILADAKAEIERMILGDAT